MFGAPDMPAGGAPVGGGSRDGCCMGGICGAAGICPIGIGAGGAAAGPDIPMGTAGDEIMAGAPAGAAGAGGACSASGAPVGAGSGTGSGGGSSFTVLDISQVDDARLRQITLRCQGLFL